MRQPFQRYYSSLSGFRGYFDSGVPVLMYHKVGPRPSGTVFKALYVSPKLFRSQMSELRQAGFTTIFPGGACSATDNRARHVVITFDDGFRNVFDNALRALEENGFRAIQFLVAGMIGGSNAWDSRDGEVQERLMDAGAVREWIAAGHRIGSHTMTHPFLKQIPIEQAREEIFASRKSLEDTFGVPVEDFCYPYGISKAPRIRDFVVEAGYRTACTTTMGLNTSADSCYEIKRYFARYATPRPKEVLARLTDRVFTEPLNRREQT